LASRYGGSSGASARQLGRLALSIAIDAENAAMRVCAEQSGMILTSLVMGFTARGVRHWEIRVILRSFPNDPALLSRASNFLRPPEQRALVSNCTANPRSINVLTCHS